MIAIHARERNHCDARSLHRTQTFASVHSEHARRIRQDVYDITARRLPLGTSRMRSAELSLPSYRAQTATQKHLTELLRRRPYG
jgi:hypothetical protein